MFITNAFKGDVVKAALKSVANSNDTKTTVIGIAAAAAVGSGINWTQLFQGDGSQLGNLAAAIAIGLFAYYTNKPSEPGKPV